MSSLDHENEEVDEKPRTLFVGNIPATMKKRELELLFGDVGPIKRCYIQYPKKGPGPDKAEPLVAYITYALTEDATTAIEKFTGHKLEKNKLNIKLVKSRTEQHREPRASFGGNESLVEEKKKRSLKQMKEQKEKKKVKKSRLIIRNISFQTTEEKLKEHFGTCGKLTDVNILRKRDGKLVGCAFIQYENIHEAFKALKELNGHEFMGRPVVLDWAVPKDQYAKASKESEEVTVKSEPEDSDDEDVKVKKEKTAELKNDNDEESNDHDDEDEIEDLEDDDDEDDDIEEEKPTPRVKSQDADEGKTLFLRNLSFDTTNEELKEFFLKFGDLHYALICMDSLTEHSKGTGFVKFKNLEDAEKCLEKYEEDESEFQLNDRRFYMTVALSKGRLEEKMQSGVKDEPKDNRHLYLTREGFIRPGSEAALGVSATDMNKRAVLHQRKKQMLKDLSIFVSTTRLCVHNLPPSLTDEQLKRIFLKYAGHGAKITEARVMRDLKTIKHVSKEFGFVTFSTHPHALTALRAINNNPTVFTPSKRPIVEFSLENRKAIKAKENRLQKSKEGLQMKPEVEEEEEEAEEKNEKKLSKKQKRKLKKQGKVESKVKVDEDTEVQGVAQDGSEAEEDDEEPVLKKKKKLRHRDQKAQIPDYAGLVGKKGITTLPAMKAKGKITRKSLKLKKKPKRLERRPKEPKSVPKARPSRDISDNIDKFASKRKKETSRIEKKWYE